MIGFNTEVLYIMFKSKSKKSNQINLEHKLQHSRVKIITMGVFPLESGII